MQNYQLTHTGSQIDAAVDLANNAQPKISGKGLSTNDYTNDEKTKLSGIETGANKTIVDDDFSDVSTNPLQNKVITELFQPISQSDYDALETYTKPLYFILDDEED